MTNRARAKHYGLLDKWSDEELIAVAKECGTRRAFARHHIYKYVIAKDRGIIDWLPSEPRIEDFYLRSRAAPRTQPQRYRRRKSGGFNFNKPGTLYYLRVQPEGWDPLWKVGITNFDANQRFCHSFNKGRFVVLNEQRFEVGKLAYLEEQRILREHADHLYTGEDYPLKGVGISEMFTKDVLRLDEPHQPI